MNDLPAFPTNSDAPDRGRTWFPLTAQQTPIWVDEQLQADTRFYQWALAVQVPGALDPTRVEQAWKALLEGHDVLRAVVDRSQSRQAFSSTPQAIRRFETPPPKVDEAWLEGQALGAFDRSQPLFDLQWGPSPHGGTLLVFRSHEVVVDKPSLAYLVEEFSDLYLSAKGSVSSPFREAIDDAGSEETRKKVEADTQAWHRLLGNPPPQAELLGWSRKAASAPIRTRVVPLTAQAHPALADLPRDQAEEVILATTAFLWVQRLSGQNDNVIAVPRDRRPTPGHRIIGPFTETSYLRVEVDPDQTITALLEKVRLAHQFTRDHGYASTGGKATAGVLLGPCLEFPDEFCGLKAEFSVVNSSNLTEAGLIPGDRIDALGLAYALSERSPRIEFTFHEATYPGTAQDRLVSAFLRILDAVFTAPGQVIKDLVLVSPDEAAQLVALGRGQEPPVAADLLTNFALQVRRRPQAAAVEFGDKVVSYQELDQATDRIARKLQNLGVTAGSRVAVAMPRGFGEIAAFLATLKAGGAYVPIDPSHPVERVRVILEDALPQALVAPTGSSLLPALPTGAASLALDDPFFREPGDDAPFVQPEVKHHQLSYILFTSGSTGRPKGVEVHRQAFANFLQSMAREPGLSETDRVLAITTTTFDIAGLELFLPLYVGATVVIADSQTALDPVRLQAFLQNKTISLAQATPATWRMLLDTGWSGHPNLRMITGGEALNISLAHRLLRCGSQLWNAYGPTETTVWSTLELVPPNVEKITIGHAIDHTQITIRDQGGRHVPWGGIGEICIGGRGMALGYFGRPDLTAEKFLTDPVTGEGYYKAGDLGRFLPDGRIECLGRVDHQMKIRGFRIEPGDIEAQLRKVEGVKEVVIVAIANGDGDPQLAAYWVGSASKDDMARHAKANLPHYMVPSIFIPMEAFPLTTSGKIDRKQLPKPGADQGTEVDPGMGPRNDLEAVLAAIWREILGLPFVPINEDFFSLGGTSLRAIKMRTRVQQELGVELPLRALFEAPTIEGLVPQLGKGGSDSAPIVVQLKKGQDPHPWIGLLGVHLFQEMADTLGDGSSLLGMHIPLLLQPGAPDALVSIPELAARYVAVIRQHQPHGPYYLLGLCHGGIIAFEAAVQLEEAGEKVASVVLLDAELPLARRTLIGRRLVDLALKVFLSPGKVWRKLTKKLAIKPVVAPQPGSDGQQWDAAQEEDVIENNLLHYQSLNHRVSCEVLAFRALYGDAASWQAVAADMGWTGRAAQVHAFDVPSTHLGIVRLPHVETVVQKMAEARQRYQG